MSRNAQAYQTLKVCLTTNCHLRNDELAMILEYMFRHLNHNYDDSTAANNNVNLTPIIVNITYIEIV